MEINLNEEDIDIKEDDTNPEDENVGPWIYKNKFRTPDGGYEQYGLKSYCKERVFCKSGYKASSCKQTIESPIKCIPITGGRRTRRKSRKNKKSRRR
jgi:hypothetical protein